MQLSVLEGTLKIPILSVKSSWDGSSEIRIKGRWMTYSLVDLKVLSKIIKLTVKSPCNCSLEVRIKVDYIFSAKLICDVINRTNEVSAA
jgi:hypothetical protein